MTGAHWCALVLSAGRLSPWATVYQQARRWLEAGCFDACVHDLRLLLRVLQGRTPQPSAAILDARVLQSSPLLNQAALDAVKQWEFTPTLLNGVAVPVIMTVTVMFTLK